MTYRLCRGDPLTGQRCDALTKTARCARHGGSPYNAEHRRTSLALRQRWIAEHGLWCPGYGVAGHSVRSIADLCADHRISGTVAAGYGVLCVSCNSRKH